MFYSSLEVKQIFSVNLHYIGKVEVTHSSILAWRILGTEKPSGCHQWGRTELDTTEATYQQQQQRLGIFFGPFLPLNFLNFQIY